MVYIEPAVHWGSHPCSQVTLRTCSMVYVSLALTDKMPATSLLRKHAMVT